MRNKRSTDSPDAAHKLVDPGSDTTTIAPHAPASLDHAPDTASIDTPPPPEAPPSPATPALSSSEEVVALLRSLCGAIDSNAISKLKDNSIGAVAAYAYQQTCLTLKGDAASPLDHVSEGLFKAAFQQRSVVGQAPTYGIVMAMDQSSTDATPMTLLIIPSASVGVMCPSDRVLPWSGAAVSEKSMTGSGQAFFSKNALTQIRGLIALLSSSQNSNDED